MHAGFALHDFAGSVVVHATGGVLVATLAGFTVYGAIRATIGLRLDEEAEFDGADLAIHRISATPRRGDAAPRPGRTGARHPKPDTEVSPR